MGVAQRCILFSICNTLELIQQVKVEREKVKKNLGIEESEQEIWKCSHGPQQAHVAVTRLSLCHEGCRANCRTAVRNKTQSLFCRLLSDFADSSDLKSPWLHFPSSLGGYCKTGPAAVTVCSDSQTVFSVWRTTGVCCWRIKSVNEVL